MPHASHASDSRALAPPTLSPPRLPPPPRCCLPSARALRRGARSTLPRTVFAEGLARLAAPTRGSCRSAGKIPRGSCFKTMPPRPRQKRGRAQPTPRGRRRRSKRRLRVTLRCNVFVARRGRWCGRTRRSRRSEGCPRLERSSSCATAWSAEEDGSSEIPMNAIALPPPAYIQRQHPNCSRGTREVNGGSRGTTHSTATAQSTTRRRCNCNGPYLYIRFPLTARATIVLISCCSDKSQASFLSPAFRPHPWKGGCVRVCGFSAGEGGMSEAAETRAYRMIAQRNHSLRTSPPAGEWEASRSNTTKH